MNPWPYPRLFAHRGGGSHAPENTLAAVRLGLSLGYRACEFDVKLSADGEPWLMHDSTLERTSDGKGSAGDRTWAELSRLDAGTWHSAAFSGEPPPRLEAVARALRASGGMANVEIKPSPGRERETGRAVAQACARLWKGAEVAPLLSSFSREALLAAREAEPSLPRGWLIETPGEEDFAWIETIGAVSLHCSHKAVTPALVERVHGGGRRLLAWTVNDPDRAEALLSLGVDGLFTDSLLAFAGRFPELR